MLMHMRHMKDLLVTRPDSKRRAGKEVRSPRGGQREIAQWVRDARTATQRLRK